MADRDAVDKALDELLKGKKPEEILGERGVARELTKRLVERALQGEMTAHLGYEKHAAEGRNSGNSRNGTTPKTVLDESGEMTIEVPRDRNGDFEPQIVPKGRRRLPGFDDKVIALYARGMTTREIQGGLLEIYGTEVLDDANVFITSANFTEAALDRNIDGSAGSRPRAGGKRLDAFPRAHRSRVASSASNGVNKRTIGIEGLETLS